MYFLTSAACVSWCNKVRPVKSSKKECEELKTLARKLNPSRSYWSRTCQINKQKRISNITPITWFIIIFCLQNKSTIFLNTQKMTVYCKQVKIREKRMIFSPKSISKVGKGGGKRKEGWGLRFTDLNIFLTL